jgi:hypothetical protein
MKFEYAQPFSFTIGYRPEAVVSRIRHGVTEITLSDGRLVRATLHVKAVKTDPNKPGSVDVSYNIVAEIMNAPDVPISDVHETIQ